MKIHKKDCLGKRQPSLKPVNLAGYRRRTAIWFKEALIEKLATIHDGWIIQNMKKADRVVEQLDDEQRTLLDIALSLSAN